MKAVNTYSALNKDEPDNDDKPSLAEAYVGLTEMNNIKANDIAWISFDLKDDLQPDLAIADIRSHRGLDVDEDLINKPVHEIRLRRHVYANSINHSLTVDRIYFSFATPGDENSSEAKRSPEGLAIAAYPLPGSGEDEVKNEDILEKMLAEVKEKEITSLFKILWEIEEILLQTESNPKPLASLSESDPDSTDFLFHAMSD
ncbi:hypothetical protein Cpir12675_000582 [Ceratocystis pirilliformis]|uniref:Uncharacterized protein n=1 Tax=Ceratocystis pirilliformis TaxID=259994 RepID=A0ABR3ZKM8_9PEZI